MDFEKYRREREQRRVRIKKFGIWAKYGIIFAIVVLIFSFIPNLIDENLITILQIISVVNLGICLMYGMEVDKEFINLIKFKKEDKPTNGDRPYGDFYPYIKKEKPKDSETIECIRCKIKCDNIRHKDPKRKDYCCVCLPLRYYTKPFNEWVCPRCLHHMGDQRIKGRDEEIERLKSLYENLDKFATAESRRKEEFKEIIERLKSELSELVINYDNKEKFIDEQERICLERVNELNKANKEVERLKQENEELNNRNFVY